MILVSGLFGFACLSALLMLMTRDSETFGEPFLLRSCAAWVVVAAAGGARALLAPGPETAVIFFGVGAVYLLVIALTVGHPAKMLAPYDEEARKKLSGRECSALYLKGWVLTVAIVLGLFAYLWVVEPF